MNSNVKTDKRSFTACSTAIALACVLSASNAFAGDQIPSETVKFADLKVDTSTGAEVLYRRIQSAARRVCSYDATSIQGSSTWQNCVRPTVDAAVAKVNNPQLTALHTGHKPAPATAMIDK
jgi:UrcA family protein